MTDKQMKTPLPWAAHPTGKGMQGYEQPIAIVQEGAANMIAGVFRDVQGGEAVAEANAAFIIEAVNNYERVCGELEQWQDDAHKMHEENESLRAQNAAYAQEVGTSRYVLGLIRMAAKGAFGDVVNADWLLETIDKAALANHAEVNDEKAS